MSKLKIDKKIRSIFMGTPDFAVPSLKSLIESNNFEIVSVFSQPDRPKGRNRKLSQPPVKELALKYSIPVFQPESIKDEIETIKKLKPDLIVVIAYGQILPTEILEIPEYKCINVHGSLLPKYRGSSCLNAPILNGDSQTGLSIMEMDKGMDTGAIIAQFPLQLNDESSLEYIHDSLSSLSAKVLPQTLLAYINNELKASPQDESLASYVNLIKKSDGKIDWNDSAIKIERQVRAYHPWPGAFTYNKDSKRIKIIKAKVLEKDSENKASVGEVYELNNNIAIRCGQNSLIILELQLEGAKAMSSSQFLSGHPDIIGQILK